MGMKVRFELARGMCGEARVKQPPGRLMDDFASIAAAQLGMLLDPAERGADRFLMRSDDALVARDQRHDRHRLGGVDREVPPRMVLNLAVPDAPKLLLADLPRKQRLERLAVDRSFESQIGGDLRSEEHTSELQSLMRI